MTLLLPRRGEEAIRAHGAATYPEECCGVLIGTEGRGDQEGDLVVRVRETRPLANTAPAPRTRGFLIDPLEVLRIEAGLGVGPERIVGCYHSHPEGPAEPSLSDHRQAWPGLSYVILAVQRGVPYDLASWRLSEDRSRFLRERVERDGRLERAERYGRGEGLERPLIGVLPS